MKPPSFFATRDEVAKRSDLALFIFTLSWGVVAGLSVGFVVGFLVARA